MVLSDLSCNGNEEALEQCHNFRWGYIAPMCDHSHDASVNCSGKPNYVLYKFHSLPERGAEKCPIVFPLPLITGNGKL